jgi:hypothetical protein
MSKRVDQLSTEELATFARQAGKAAFDHAMKKGVRVAGYADGLLVEAVPATPKKVVRARAALTTSRRKAG